MHACRHAVFGLASCHVPDDVQQLYFCTVSWVAFPRPRSTKHSTWGWRASRGLLGLSDALSGLNPDGPLYWEPYLNAMSLLSSSVIKSQAWRLLRHAVTNLSFCMMCVCYTIGHMLFTDLLFADNRVKISRVFCTNALQTDKVILVIPCAICARKYQDFLYSFIISLQLNERAMLHNRCFTVANSSRDSSLASANCGTHFHERVASSGWSRYNVISGEKWWTPKCWKISI